MSSSDLWRRNKLRHGSIGSEILNWNWRRRRRELRRRRSFTRSTARSAAFRNRVLLDGSALPPLVFHSWRRGLHLRSGRRTRLFRRQHHLILHACLDDNRHHQHRGRRQRQRPAPTHPGARFRRRSPHRVLSLAQHETIELRGHFGAVQLAILPGHAGIPFQVLVQLTLGQLWIQWIVGRFSQMTRSTAGSEIDAGAARRAACLMRNASGSSQFPWRRR